MSEQDPIQPYIEPLESGQPDVLPEVIAQSEPLPDVQQVEQSVIDQRYTRRRNGVLVASLATVVLSGAVFGIAYAHREDTPPAPATETPWAGENPIELPETVLDVCFSDVVERTITGDPAVQSDDPETWVKGEELAVRPSQKDGYQGVRIGFRGTDQELTVDDNDWSAPVLAADLKDNRLLMRTGHDTYMISIQAIATPGSAACDEKPHVTFSPVRVADALANDDIEPSY